MLLCSTQSAADDYRLNLHIVADSLRLYAAMHNEPRLPDINETSRRELPNIIVGTIDVEVATDFPRVSASNVNKW